MSAVYSLFADFDAYGRTLPPHAPTESLLTGNVLAVVIASAVVHYGLYAFSRPDRLDAASRTRVASQFHAILSIAALAAWFWCYDVDPWDKANARRLTHGFEADGDHWFPIFTAVSSGYFVADTLAILSCKEAFDGQALVHHAIIGPAFLLGLHFRTLFPYQFFFLGEELSTVALNFKWFSPSGSASNKFWSYTFAAFFVLSRFVYGTWLYLSVFPVYAAVRHSLTPAQHTIFIYELLCSTLSRFLNLFWLVLIARKLARMCSRPAAAKDKKAA